jgi:hypothetical protein
MCLQWRDPRPLANRPVEQSRSGAPQIGNRGKEGHEDAECLSIA